MGRLEERGSIRLSILSQNGDSNSTTKLYFDMKDGESRWYRSINDQSGHHESLVVNGTEYSRYDPAKLEAGIKTAWKTGTNEGLFDEIPEYREKKKGDLLYPQELMPLFTWSDAKEQYSVIRQFDKNQYEFQYSALALDQIRQERIQEARRYHQWLLEIIDEDKGIENSEIYLQSSAMAVRQAEEVRETSKTERICLDESGDIKTVENVTGVEMKMVMPNLETGEIRVSKETDTLEGSSVLEIETVDDPSISAFLDEMVYSMELEGP